ncbi:efflux RND transporter periplasmic adaptor subunit [Polyangium sorediatum]|uniref:Efflux RND transporter periplasmic adaptor subunit n=1 Tax=Polyangium sorediatum TaxID=889274 RepID=A0ABT6P7A0_9BACT|nr:efflux RND transporter periplasmic adaptor subunit [Polyangium sorediatum]MDI1436496.1 efflux RND transporter periplasmic adaptor subunit [Polyangium sorediatum]
MTNETKPNDEDAETPLSADEGLPERDTQPPRASTEPPRPRWARWGIAAGLSALAAAGMLVWLRGGDGEADVPVTKADVPHVEGKAIVFSKAFGERAGIETEPVRLSPLVPRIKVVGTVDFDPAHVAAVGTRIPGLVRSLVKVEGESVKKGDVLAEIESAELGTAQASVAVAHAHRKAASINEKRERELAERGLSTAREHEVATATHEEQRAVLEAARQRVHAMSGSPGSPFGVYMLRAPLEGTVVERHIFAGQSVDAHLVAFRVANLDHLWVDLSVFESNVDAIHKDDPVEISRVVGGEPIPGRVAHVGDVVDPVTRTAEVRVAVSNQERKLRPGQSVTAIIQATGPSRTMLTVPITAVTYIDGRPTVFLAESPDRVVPTTIELGPNDGTHQGVTAGLSEGQLVVSRGVFALKSELYR